MSQDISAELEWKGKTYELKYTFDLARKLRADGLNLIATYRAVTSDPAAAIDYGDEVASIIAWLLRRAGCDVTDEDVWRYALSDESTLRQCFGLFNWVCGQHMASSSMAPMAQQASPKKTKSRQARAS